jgi:cytoskeletal protein RodZ
MDQTGAALKKLRLEKGISLEEVHKKTKIHPNILKAIEGDSLTNLSPIYLKGFLKIYCNFLGVDPKPYTSQVKPEPKKEPKAEPRPKAPAKKAEGKKAPPKTQAPHVASLVIKKGAVVLKKLGARLKKISVQGLIYLRSHAQTIKRAVFFILSIVIILFVFSSCVRFVSARFKAFNERRKSTAAKIQKQPVKIPAKPAPKLTTRPSAAAPSVSSSETAVKAVVPAAESKEVSPVIRLGVRAKGNCWVSVKVDGKVVFQRTLEKGRFESWQAKDKIELSVGNAAAVELEVNGQLFSNLGRKGQALKNILITKDGLKTAP